MLSARSSSKGVAGIAPLLDEAAQQPRAAKALPLSPVDSLKPVTVDPGAVARAHHELPRKPRPQVIAGQIGHQGVDGIFFASHAPLVLDVGPHRLGWQHALRVADVPILEEGLVVALVSPHLGLDNLEELGLCRTVYSRERKPQSLLRLVAVVRVLDREATVVERAGVPVCIDCR